MRLGTFNFFLILTFVGLLLQFQVFPTFCVKNVRLTSDAYAKKKI